MIGKSKYVLELNLDEISWIKTALLNADGLYGKETFAKMTKLSQDLSLLTVQGHYP